jgi:sugar-phosphatase
MGNSEIEARLAARDLMIFDFDGTLADTTPLHIAAFAEVLEPFGVTVDYPSIAGRKTRDALRDRLATVGRVLPDFDLDELAASKQRKVRDLIRNTLRPLPGVEQFLAWALARMRLAIYSSGSRGTIEVSLERLRMRGRFDPVLCAEDVEHAKPDPEGFLKVLAITGVPTHRAVVFEDSDAGVASARAAELDVVDVRVTPFEQLSATLT